MKKRISDIAPWQTAKTLALLYFALGLVLAIPLGLMASVVPIGCWVYNKAARITVGIEIAVESESAA